MKRVGTVVGTAQSIVVVRAEHEEHPRLGTAVVDEHLETVGRVVDVFGPVARPYLAVTPREEPLATLVGSTLYSRT